jgi:hypothetical protein
MKNLRSVGGLLAISAVLSCATAINDGTVPGPSTPPDAGSDAGGGAGLPEEGGAPGAGGSTPQAGGPASAGKGGGGSGSAGSPGTGGKGGGTAGSTGKGGSGSGGTVGVAGSSSTGGKAGTGSSGAGGSSVAGAGGGSAAGYCDNPVDLPATAMNTGNIGTAAACFRTKATFNTIVCSNMADRTVKVNGMLAMCSVKTAFPPAIDGWNYFDITAGAMSYAQLGWFSG